MQEIDFTVVVGCLVEHVRAADPRSAYVRCLENLHAETEPEAELYPFDLAEARYERPLVAVFAGHLMNLAEHAS